MFKNCFILILSTLCSQAQGQDVLSSNILKSDSVSYTDTLRIVDAENSISAMHLNIKRNIGFDSTSTILKRYLNIGKEDTLKVLQADYVSDVDSVLESNSIEYYKITAVDSLLKHTIKSLEFQDSEVVQKIVGKQFKLGEGRDPLNTDFKKGAAAVVDTIFLKYPDLKERIGSSDSTNNLLKRFLRFEEEDVSKDLQSDYVSDVDSVVESNSIEYYKITSVDSLLKGTMKSLGVQNSDLVQKIVGTQFKVGEGRDPLNTDFKEGTAAVVDTTDLNYPLWKDTIGSSDSLSRLVNNYLKTGLDGSALKERQEGKVQSDIEEFDLESSSADYFKNTPVDSLLKDILKAKDFQDAGQLQKELGSEFNQEFEGGLNPLTTGFNMGTISKRVLSVDDREIVDSIRNLGLEKLYNIKDEVQDSVGMYLLSEKEKFKENLFFEGLISTGTLNGDLTVSDFSGSLGVRLRKFYEVGMGPEIGVSGNDFSAIGARLFARRRIFEDKLFVIVENSFRKKPDFGETVPNAESMTSNLKFGAGRMFNLSPNGRTRLNVQTLVSPQYLKTGSSSLVDFRLGISKLSRKP